MKKYIYLLSLLAMCACGQQEEQQQKRSYEVMTVQPSSVSIDKSYSAAIEGKQDISIMPQVSGFITRLCVTEGQHVKKGQELFVIDPVNFQAALRIAQANEEAAQALVATNQLTFDSKQKLYDEQVISAYDLQVAKNALLTAKAQLAQAQAGVINAQQNLSYTSVKAPCDGVVGRLPHRVGTLVSPQMPTPLTTVSDNSEMYVYFSMTEQQMLDMAVRYGSVEN
ncbi:MAG: efflux RND transporter periplasmic adaptor subunit, partial [Paludibacteraceae bacterium]|nr:efflux RND transporter periplasmic adaptor subunit [Paludibacteraceae bacterium]